MNEYNSNSMQFLNIFKNYKKIWISLGIFIILVFTLFLWFDYSDKINKKKISEDFIKAKVLISEKQLENSTQILTKIITKKDNIYSPLSLFILIDRKLENDENKIIDYFNVVLSIKNLNKEDLNLIILKKAIFISETGEEQEIIKLLNPIINSDSVWKMESLKFLGDYYFSYKQFNKAKQYYSVILSENPENIDLNEIKRKMNIIKNG